MVKILVAQFVLSYAYILLKAWQQLNVHYDKFWWIAPTSVLMALGEVYTVHNMLKADFSLWYVACMGVGAALGSMTAMVLHKKFR